MFDRYIEYMPRAMGNIIYDERVEPLCIVNGQFSGDMEITTILSRKEENFLINGFLINKILVKNIIFITCFVIVSFN